jgi:hypothetical protein
LKMGRAAVAMWHACGGRDVRAAPLVSQRSITNLWDTLRALVPRSTRVRKGTALVGALGITWFGSLGTASLALAGSYVSMSDFNRLAKRVAHRVEFIDGDSSYTEKCQRDSRSTAYCRYKLYDADGYEQCSTVLFEWGHRDYVSSRYNSGDC